MKTKNLNKKYQVMVLTEMQIEGEMENNRSRKLNKSKRVRKKPFLKQRNHLS
jgi:hypothetical protein